MEMLPDDFFHVTGNVLLKPNGLLLELLVKLDFLFCPHYVRAANLPHGDVRIVLGVSPVTRTADFGLLKFKPIYAVFAGPRFGPVRE